MWVVLKFDWRGKKAGEKIELADEHAQILLDAGTAAKADGDPLADAVAGAAGKAAEKFTAMFDDIAAKFLKDFADAAGKSRKNAVPAIFGPGNAGDPKKSFGDWLLCVARGDRKTLEERYGSVYLADSQQKAALNTGTGTQGGYQVPEEFYSQMMQLAAEGAIARTRATVIPMGARSCKIPALDAATAPAAGDTAMFGGVVARWTEEGTTLNETEPTFKDIELVAHELSGYSIASNSLLEDTGGALESVLLALFGGAVVWYEDYAFLRGDGVGKPLGAVGPATGAAKAVNRNTASQVKLVDMASMVAALLPGWQPARTTWLCSPTALAQVIQLSDTAGNIIWIPNGREALPMSAFGIPLLVTEKLPALGTARDLSLVDWSRYLVGDRRQVAIDYSPHIKFLTNQGAWRFVHRVDGQPWLRSAVTLSDATSTVSPFVYLN
jgi:HK97 family phage major capsid protein